MKPAYEIRVRKLDGVPYSSHSLIYRGQVLRSQLSSFSPAEITWHIETYTNPPVASVKEFVAPKPGRPRKSASINSNGFIWGDQSTE